MYLLSWFAIMKKCITGRLFCPFYVHAILYSVVVKFLEDKEETYKALQMHNFYKPFLKF